MGKDFLAIQCNMYDKGVAESCLLILMNLNMAFSYEPQQCSKQICFILYFILFLLYSIYSLLLRVILIFFELSYLIRFLWDVTFKTRNTFVGILCYDIVSYIDGFAFLALLLSHRKNFKIRQDTAESANPH